MPTYQELLTQAEPARRRLEARDKVRVVVGVDTSTIANGALETFAALKAEIERRGLNVNFGQVGGRGLNFADPVVEVDSPDGSRVLYQKVRAEDATAFLDAALVSGQRRERWLLGVLNERPGEPDPSMRDHEWWAIQERRLMADMGEIDPEDIDEA